MKKLVGMLLRKRCMRSIEAIIYIYIYIII